ncbi:DUF7670 domain-containing protein [Marinifilum caeruleilacunae]|uniref:DUF7670 domain-containing protein n=1 Tax=Marinifilum caeruleilacunae TaxID=2499076 RepID=A0ABX1WQ94_9BACT|nr:hypothetical protein [Marinifilum caeruleilacunae]NOU58256.1 hypothetical protein [Marinifilum caeruleilacunae]
MKLAVSIIRWVARFLGIFLFLFFLWFAIEIGAPDLDMMSNQEVKLFTANLLMLIGLIVVWKFEFIGSLFLLGGYIFFSIVNYSFWIGPVFPIFSLIGILHIFCWFSDVLRFSKTDKFSFRFFLK